MFKLRRRCKFYIFLNENINSPFSQFSTTFGREVPCFHPLVYTVNDENGLNGPIIDEIVEACQKTGCDPFCSRGGGMCVKYTVTDRSKSRVVRWESHFCGQGVKWNGDQVSGTRCFWEDNVQGNWHYAFKSMIIFRKHNNQLFFVKINKEFSSLYLHETCVMKYLNNISFNQKNCSVYLFLSVSVLIFDFLVLINN